jgi:hypothetical protein
MFEKDGRCVEVEMLEENRDRQSWFVFVEDTTCMIGNSEIRDSPGKLIHESYDSAIISTKRNK